MNQKIDRKEAIRQYKERKIALGTFAVRCTANGQTWVGSSRNLDAAKNGAWFGLRLGSYPAKSLQREWTAHGETAFQFEILEKLDEDAPPLGVKDLLAEKRRYWIKQLNALPI